MEEALGEALRKAIRAELGEAVTGAISKELEQQVLPRLTEEISTRVAHRLREDMWNIFPQMLRDADLCRAPAPAQQLGGGAEFAAGWMQPAVGGGEEGGPFAATLRAGGSQTGGPPVLRRSSRERKTPHPSPMPALHLPAVPEGSRENLVGDSNLANNHVDSLMMPQRVPRSARRQPGAEVWGPGSQASGKGGGRRWQGPDDAVVDDVGPGSSVSQQQGSRRGGHRRGRSGPGRAPSPGPKARETSVDESQKEKDPYAAYGAPQEQHRNCEIPCWDRVEL